MMIRTLLDVLIPIIWSLLAAGVGFYFWRTRRRYGLQAAIKRLFSFRVYVPLALVLSLSILRMALVFIYPQQIGVVVSIFSQGGVRSQPLGGGVHWIVPLAVMEGEKTLTPQTQSAISSTLPHADSLTLDIVLKATESINHGGGYRLRTDTGQTTLQSPVFRFSASLEARV